MEFTRPKNQIAESFTQLMIILVPLFLIIAFFFVWLFANQMRQKSNLFYFELLEVSLVSLEKKTPAAQAVSVFRPDHILLSTDRQEFLPNSIDGLCFSKSLS